jgi:hypothetical protein
MSDIPPSSWQQAASPPLPAQKILKRIGPLKLGLMLGAMYALLSLFFIPIILLVSAVQVHHAAASGQAQPNAMPVLFTGVFVCFIPVIYGAMGFIGGVIMGAIYNLVARFVGGIEVTVEDAPA